MTCQSSQLLGLNKKLLASHIKATKKDSVTHASHVIGDTDLPSKRPLYCFPIVFASAFIMSAQSSAGGSSSSSDISSSSFASSFACLT